MAAAWLIALCAGALLLGWFRAITGTPDRTWALTYAMLALLTGLILLPYPFILWRQAKVARASRVALTPEGVRLALPTPRAFMEGQRRVSEVFIPWQEIRGVRDTVLRLPLPLGPFPVPLFRLPYPAFAIDTDKGHYILMPAVIPRATQVAAAIAQGAESLRRKGGTIDE
ncbi:MAG: hypothetical protein D6819_10405 [Gammaproteobacteria bacterium]|nr:MAG: hypothetical protein D6819_10405 [Gammaproteobacteria bacterium]